MSPAYLQGQALYNKCASGRGTIVIVEGETPQQDPYFYGRWFGDRAREVSFFPQNGWQEVVAAVSDLRAQLPGRQVFGIVDRDHADDSVLQVQATAVPADGVFRTRFFTLENYLLSPVGWSTLVGALHRGEAPLGWATAADVQVRIEEAYRRCIKMAAFNYTVCKEYERYPRAGLAYKEHPDAVLTPEKDLKRWGVGRNAPEPLENVYTARAQMLSSQGASAYPELISGKAVLRVFLRAFPFPKNKVIAPDDMLSLYVDRHPSPPAELQALVSRIVDRNAQP